MRKTTHRHILHGRNERGNKGRMEGWWGGMYLLDVRFFFRDFFLASSRSPTSRTGRTPPKLMLSASSTTVAAAAGSEAAGTATALACCEGRSNEAIS